MTRNVLILTLLFLLSAELHAGIVILNGLTHSYRTQKGNVYRGKIELQNTGSRPQSVKLYLQDLTYQYDGTILYLPPSSNQGSNSHWIDLQSGLLSLKERERTEVFYEIRVPDSVSQGGSYWSTIIVEPVDHMEPNGSGGGVQITSVVRYAIQVITDFATEGLRPELVFKRIDVSRKGDQAFLNVALANSGKVYCRPRTSIELFDARNAEKVSHLHGQELGLLPGTSKTYSIDAGKLPPGRYKAVLYASDREHNVFSIQVELEI